MTRVLLFLAFGFVGLDAYFGSVSVNLFDLRVLSEISVLVIFRRDTRYDSCKALLFIPQTSWIVKTEFRLEDIENAHIYFDRSVASWGRLLYIHGWVPFPFHKAFRSNGVKTYNASLRLLACMRRFRIYTLSTT